MIKFVVFFFFAVLSVSSFAGDVLKETQEVPILKWMTRVELCTYTSQIGTAAYRIKEAKLKLPKLYPTGDLAMDAMFLKAATYGYNKAKDIDDAAKEAFFGCMDADQQH